MYQVQMQFIPGNDSIWVLKLHPEDPIYEYEDETEAINKANELQSLDSSGRAYKVVYL
jgi:hypothetical protein